MTVKELKELLNTIPDDYIVKIDNPQETHIVNLTKEDVYEYEEDKEVILVWDDGKV